MVTQRDVLKYIARRTREERSTAFDDLAEKFDLQPSSVCDRLKRLWRERLIRTTTSRPARFHHRLQPEESIEDLRFRLAPRGRKRLEWYREQEKDDGWF